MKILFAAENVDKDASDSQTWYILRVWFCKIIRRIKIVLRTQIAFHSVYVCVSAWDQLKWHQADILK
jgi:hypothetical protein